MYVHVHTSTYGAVRSVNGAYVAVCRCRTLQILIILTLMYMHCLGVEH